MLVARRSLNETSAKNLGRVVDPEAAGGCFHIAASMLREYPLACGYEELSAIGEHAMAVVNLPNIHRDPFDRIVIAQAFAEGIVLLTSDKTVARYGGLVQHV
jgi:PIN domain nuclease of toxin-antitoxin system